MSYLNLVDQAASPATPSAGEVDFWVSNDSIPIFKKTNPDATVNSILDTGFVTAKGDLLIATGANAVARVAVGTDGTFAMAKSAAASGIAYGKPIASVAGTQAVAGPFAADTYFPGTAIIIPTAGAWQAGWIYKAQFDMTKTALGTATPIITIRMGTLGAIGDAAILTLTHAAGTAAVDTGIFEIMVEFRSVGAGTSAVVAGTSRIDRNSTTLTAGLVNNNAGVVAAASSGFASTTQTAIGLSFNGGASFSGTNVSSFAYLIGAGATPIQ